MRLYDISEAILSILGEEEAELTPEAEQALSAMQMEFYAKAEAILQYRQGLEREAAAFEQEIERLDEKRCSLFAKSERLAKYLQGEMKRLGIKRVSTTTFNATRINNPPKVKDDCVNMDELPAEFVRIVPENRELDKKAVLEAWKNNNNVMLPAGISIVTGEERLQVS